ncbi:MAG: cyclic nucleotide-binding domain-containing protein [Solirubrobacterales bacterium]
MADLPEKLAGVPLFSRLSPRDLKQLAKRMNERRWNEGETVIEEGKGGAGFWVIEAGNATISVRGKSINTLGPGEHFGEIALLDDGPRSATVTAATDLTCFGIVAWEFAPFVRENPDVAWTLMQTLAARLRDAESRRAT